MATIRANLQDVRLADETAHRGLKIYAGRRRRAAEDRLEHIQDKRLRRIVTRPSRAWRRCGPPNCSASSSPAAPPGSGRSPGARAQRAGDWRADAIAIVLRLPELGHIGREAAALAGPGAV